MVARRLIRQPNTRSQPMTIQHFLNSLAALSVIAAKTYDDFAAKAGPAKNPIPSPRSKSGRAYLDLLQEAGDNLEPLRRYGFHMGTLFRIDHQQGCATLCLYSADRGEHKIDATIPCPATADQILSSFTGTVDAEMERRQRIHDAAMAAIGSKRISTRGA
jgi:hypothetical protein